MRTKITLRLALLLLYTAIGICCKGNTESELPTYEPYIDSEATPSQTQNIAANTAREFPDDETVYICASKGAKRYHPSKDCSGLDKCTHEIKKVTVKEAEGIGLSLCHLEK